MAGAEIVLMPGSTSSIEAVLHHALKRNDDGKVSAVVVLTLDCDGQFDAECSTATFGELAMMALLFNGWVYEGIHHTEPDED
jgi:hypothetical protein